MTFTYSSIIIKNYYIELSQEKYNNNFNVIVYNIYKSGLAGFPIISKTYKTKKRAIAGFNNLIKKATNNEI